MPKKPTLSKFLLPALAAALAFAGPAPAQEAGIQVSINQVIDEWGAPKDTGKSHAVLRIRNDLDRSVAFELSGPSRHDRTISDRQNKKLRLTPGEYEIRASASALASWSEPAYSFEAGREYGILVTSSKEPASRRPSPPLVDAELDDGGDSGQESVIFRDAFDKPKSEWQQEGGSWETAGGVARQTSDDPESLNAIWYIRTPRISDATIETEVRVHPYQPAQLTDSDEDRQLGYNIRYILGAGLVFRMKDPQNYYMFRLAGEEGAVLGRMEDGEWKDFANPRAVEFLDGQRLKFDDVTYRLKVKVDGSRIVGFINDEPVATVSDWSFPIGHVGLVTFKTAAEFDYIKITE